MLRTICKGTAVLALAGLAACGDSTGPSGLTPADVTGIYEVCSLVFHPTNGDQADVDIRAAVFELDNPQAQQPSLALDLDKQFALIYVRKDQYVPQNLKGTFDLNSSQVVLNFPSGTNPSGFLLPDRLPLNFSPGAVLTLTAGQDFTYTVPRADYAKLANTSEAGLADRIPGTVEASFAAPRCP